MCLVLFYFLPSRSALTAACPPICVQRPCLLLPSFSVVECPVFFQFHLPRVGMSCVFSVPFVQGSGMSCVFPVPFVQGSGRSCVFPVPFVQGSGMSCVFPVPFVRPSSLPVPFQFLSQFLSQFLLQMCCVFIGFLLQAFFSQKEGIFHSVLEKTGLQQKPYKNTAHLQKELGKELEGNWKGTGTDKWNWKNTGHSTTLDKWNWKNTGPSTTLDKWNWKNTGHATTLDKWNWKNTGVFVCLRVCVFVLVFFCV